MKSIKLLLGISCFIYATIHAMEKKPEERLVKLTDKDKKEIIILPRRVADMSPTIHSILMEGLPEEEIGKPIPIPIAESRSLSAIAIILTEIDKNLTKRSQHKGLEDLTDLNLSNNKLTEFPTKAFSAFDDLEDLDLSNNLISKIPKLDKLGSLDSLKLARNPLIKISASLFKPLTELTDLSLANCQLTEFTEIADLPKSLEKLNLTDNNFTEETREEIRAYCKELEIKLKI